MKKNILITSICVTALAGGFLLSSTEASADPTNKTAETKGSASFSKSTNTDVLKPDEGGGTPEVITPEGGGKSDVKSDVVLVHAPDINFGSNIELNPNGDQEYHALYETATNASGEKYELPHFVQVADNSGTTGTPWTVSVSQVGTFQAEIDATTKTKHSLTNTRIRLYEASLTDSYRANATNIVKGPNISTDSFVFIPNEVDQGSLMVLESLKKTDAALSTSAAKNSVVFKKDYQASTDVKKLTSTSVSAESKNAGVRLNVPYKDGAQALSYEVVLNWTLTFGV